MNIKKRLLVVTLSALPVVVLAMSSTDDKHKTVASAENTQVSQSQSTHDHGSDNSGHAAASGHDMSNMHKETTGDHHNSMAGKPGDPANVDRTLEVSMKDTMRFTPAEVKVKAGETVRFKVKNDGRLAHEMVIGTMEELKEHAEMMRKMPSMKHAEPNMVTLEAGKSGDIVWQFDTAGTVDFACLIPGHLEAGMKGEVKVQ